MCRAVNESINTVSETRGWGCASDNHCGWIMPELPEKIETDC